ncbi:MAG: hypothetical protein ACK5L6_11075 [Anaerorhabdus sp.]|uniref:hypothetical protein n=1 Tax=Anaerorhabdus sp. TaxID=1872524 RepID=UPI003A843363
MKKLIIVVMAILALTGCAVAPVPQVTSTSMPEAIQTETPKEETSEYVKGIWEDNSYASETLNLRFDLPKGWIIAEESFQEEAIKSGGEALGAEEISGLILEFLITEPRTGLNVQGTATDIGPLLSGMSNDLIAKSCKSQLSSMEGFEYEIFDQGVMTIAGDEYGYLSIREANYGLYQKMYYKKVGNYLFNFVVTVDEKNKDFIGIFEDSLAGY